MNESTSSFKSDATSISGASMADYHNDFDCRSVHSVFSNHRNFSRIEFKMEVWMCRITADGERLWKSSNKESKKLWKHYGRNAKEMEQEWRQQTLEWVREMLVDDIKDARIEKEYNKYYQRFAKFIDVMKSKMIQETADAEKLNKKKKLPSPRKEKKKVHQVQVDMSLLGVDDKSVTKPESVQTKPKAAARRNPEQVFFI